MYNTIRHRKGKKTTAGGTLHMKILSDNAAIEKSLRGLQSSIEKAGGGLDPNLVIRCEGGELSIEKPDLDNPQKPIIAVPVELLLDTDKMNLSVSGDTMSMSPAKGALSAEQETISGHMVEIYNLTGKIPAHRQSCCWFSFRKNPDPLKKLLMARTLNEKQRKSMSFAAGAAKDIDADMFACESFIKTRTINHRHGEGEDGDKTTATADIMPVVDFLNHHSAGFGFSFSGGYDKVRPDHKFLSVRCSRPLPDSNECMVFYNQMDALDTFINYGFPDSFAPYIRSVPTQFPVPGAGKIVVHAMLGSWMKGKLHENLSGLRHFIPRTVAASPEALEVSHLLIPGNGDSPQALRRVLRLLISNRAAGSGSLSPDQTWQCVLDAEEQIIRENIAFYKGLIDDLAPGKNADDEQRKMVRNLAALQLTKLYKYSFDDSHYAEGGAEKTDTAVRSGP